MLMRLTMWVSPSVPSHSMWISMASKNIWLSSLWAVHWSMLHSPNACDSEICVIAAVTAYCSLGWVSLSVAVVCFAFAFHVAFSHTLNSWCWTASSDRPNSATNNMFCPMLWMHRFRYRWDGHWPFQYLKLLLSTGMQSAAVWLIFSAKQKFKLENQLAFNIWTHVISSHSSSDMHVNMV